MSIQIKLLESKDHQIWDSYVHNHPQATLYHLSGWKTVIAKTYGHKTYYLMATKEELKAQSSKLKTKDTAQLNPEVQSSKLEKIQHTTSHSQHTTYNQQQTPAKPVGILPLVHIKHILFGNSFISVPFFDLGGILADDEEVEEVLLSEAVRIAQDVGAKTIELRSIKPLKKLKTQSFLLQSQIDFTGQAKLKAANNSTNLSILTRAHKVRMLLDLPGSTDELMNSFKSKLRNQIRKPMKEGLKVKVGGTELLNDFYGVFSENMRDLGSPVHAKKLLQNVIKDFNNSARIVVVYQEKNPIACSMVVGFGKTLQNPWASSLRRYSKLAPNMLLYWTMLEYACNNGFRFFDFGRSTPGEGTYKFKEQWGAIPERLHWQYISFAKEYIENGKSSKDKYSKLVFLWKNLPVPITKVIGPPIRKYIGL